MAALLVFLGPFSKQGGLRLVNFLMQHRYWNICLVVLVSIYQRSFIRGVDLQAADNFLTVPYWSFEDTSFTNQNLGNTEQPLQSS